MLDHKNLLSLVAPGVYPLALIDFMLITAYNYISRKA